MTPSTKVSSVRSERDGRPVLFHDHGRAGREYRGICGADRMAPGRLPHLGSDQSLAVKNIVREAFTLVFLALALNQQASIMKLAGTAMNAYTSPRRQFSLSIH